MAINKAMLLTMLAQKAPQLLNVLQNATLNERINSKALDNSLGLNPYSTTNPENEVFAVNNPQASIDANYNIGKMLGTVPQDDASEQDLKKRMFKMLTFGNISGE